MILGYRDKKTAQFAEGAFIRAFQGFEEQAARRLSILNAATALDTLRALPGNRLEVAMNFQGLDAAEASAIWRPFLDRVAAQDGLVATPPVVLANLRKVWDAGITVAMGTEAGNIGALHGPSVFREMELMVQAGLTPLQVLRSATVNGARMMGLEREGGTLAAGRLADLVVLDADPLADIANASRIHRVVKDGRRVP